MAQVGLLGAGAIGMLRNVNIYVFKLIIKFQLCEWVATLPVANIRLFTDIYKIQV